MNELIKKYKTHIIVAIVVIVGLFLLFNANSAKAERDCKFSDCQWQNQDQHQGQIQGQLQGQAQKAYSEGSSADGYNAVATNVSNKWDSVASSAASLNLAYCADGASAQDKSAGFSIGQVNYICEAVASLKVTLLLVEMELRAHKNAHTSDSKREHANAAHRYMDDAEGIMTDVVSYIQGRANTAPISAAAKDLTWPVGLITLIFFLL